MEVLGEQGRSPNIMNLCGGTWKTAVFFSTFVAAVIGSTLVGHCIHTSQPVSATNAGWMVYELSDQSNCTNKYQN